MGLRSDVRRHGVGTVCGAGQLIAEELADDQSMHRRWDATLGRAASPSDACTRRKLLLFLVSTYDLKIRETPFCRAIARAEGQPIEIYAESGGCRLRQDCHQRSLWRMLAHSGDGKCTPRRRRAGLIRAPTVETSSRNSIEAKWSFADRPIRRSVRHYFLRPGRVGLAGMSLDTKPCTR